MTPASLNITDLTTRNPVAHLYRPAANLAVFDIALSAG